MTGKETAASRWERSLVNRYLLTAGVAAVVITGRGRIVAEERVFMEMRQGSTVLCCPVGKQTLVATAAITGLCRPVERDAAEVRVRKVARELGVVLTDHAVVVARAREVVAFVEDEVRALNDAGLLADFNREFASSRASNPTLRYADALFGYKAKMVERFADRDIG